MEVGVRREIMREVTQVVLLWTGLLQYHGWWAEVDEQSAAITKWVSSLLQDTEHLSVRESGAGPLHGEEFVSATPVMRKVAAIAAAEGAQLTLVRFLACVRAHVCLQVAFVRWGKRTQVASMGFFTWRRRLRTSYELGNLKKRTKSINKI